MPFHLIVLGVPALDRMDSLLARVSSLFNIPRSLIHGNLSSDYNDSFPHSIIADMALLLCSS